MLLPSAGTSAEADPAWPCMNLDHRICTWVQSIVNGMSFFLAEMQVSLLPGQVPPPAEFMASGNDVPSIATPNENTARVDMPRTQNETPLNALASVHPIQKPPPMPHFDALVTVWDTAHVLGGCPARMASAGVAVSSP